MLYYGATQLLISWFKNSVTEFFSIYYRKISNYHVKLQFSLWPRLLDKVLLRNTHIHSIHIHILLVIVGIYLCHCYISGSSRCDRDLKPTKLKVFTLGLFTKFMALSLHKRASLNYDYKFKGVASKVRDYIFIMP